MRTIKTVLVNITLAVCLVLLAIWGSLFALDNYTQHGETITVPDLRSLTFEQVDKRLKGKHLKYVVADSTYQVDQLPYVILEQNPTPDKKVKENRTIYLTVNAKSPPKVRMPNLVGKSLKQADIDIKDHQLKLGELEYQPSPHENLVLSQKVNGLEVKSHTLIPKGMKVDLVLGNGGSKSKIEIPYLLGLTFEEATFVLHGYGLNTGAVVYEGEITDTLGAFVFRQVPEFDEEKTLKLGEAIDVFISKEIPDYLRVSMTINSIDTINSKNTE